MIYTRVGMDEQRKKQSCRHLKRSLFPDSIERHSLLERSYALATSSQGGDRWYTR